MGGGKGNRRNRRRIAEGASGGDLEIPGVSGPRQPQSSTFDRFVELITSKLEEQHRDRSADELSAITEAVAEGSLVGDNTGPPSTPTEEGLVESAEELLQYFDGYLSREESLKLVQTAAAEVWPELGHLACHADRQEREIPTEESMHEEIDNGDEGEYICEGECELCERDVKLTRHHLIPKTCWPKMKKRLHLAGPVLQSLHATKGKETEGAALERQQLLTKLEKILGVDFSPEELPAPITNESVRAYLSQVCLICRQCHSAVHRVHPEWELALHYHTMDRLLTSHEVLKFAKWASKQKKPGKSRIK